MLHFVCDSPSFAGRMLRNFSTSNGRPCRLMRDWRKSTGRPLSSSTATAMQARNGEARTSATSATKMSIARLIFQLDRSVGSAVIRTSG